MRKRIYLILTILFALLLTSSCGKIENKQVSAVSDDTSVSISEEVIPSVSDDVVISEEPIISEETSISEEPVIDPVEEPVLTEEEEYIARTGIEIIGYYGQFETPYIVEPVYEKEITYDYPMVYDLERVTELNSKDTLNEGEVLEFYYLANNIYHHFKMMCEADTNESIEIGEDIAFRWTAFDSVADLKNYLSNLFSNDLIELKINLDNHYDGPEGGLYVVESGRGSNIYAGEDFYDIEYVNDSKIVLHIATEKFIEDEENGWPLAIVGDFYLNDFAIEKIDSRWVFTNFANLR